MATHRNLVEQAKTDSLQPGEIEHLQEIKTDERYCLYPKKSRTPVKAIRYFCLECNGWDRRKRDGQRPDDYVRTCHDPLCPLYDFRFGRNPFYNWSKKGAKQAEGVNG